MCEHDLDWCLEDLAIGNIRGGSNLDWLKQQGIDAVVCAIPILPHPIEVYTQKGFSLFHIPIDDDPGVDISKWFDDVTYFIMAHRLVKRKVFIHCHAGISRSTTLACAYIMNLFRCNDVKAIYWVRDKRPCTNMNSGFLRQLKQYATLFTDPPLIGSSHGTQSSAQSTTPNQPVVAFPKQKQNQTQTQPQKINTLAQQEQPSIIIPPPPVRTVHS